jgi:hypothetical protein
MMGLSIATSILRVMSIPLFVCADGDGIGSKVGTLADHNDVAGVRQIANTIEAGNKLIASWVLDNGGEMISQGGDEARGMVPAETIQDIEGIRQQYAQLVGATLSVGVGAKLSEAQKALLAAKLLGKDRTILYSEQVEEVLAQAAHPESEQEKIGHEYLGKGMAVNGRSNGRFQEPSKRHEDAPGPAAKPLAPAAEASEHSQGESAEQMAQEAQKESYDPETTHSAEDFENSMHQFAQDQHQKDAQAQQEQEDPREALKQKVAQILVSVRDQAPQMEQLKQGSPDLYAAMQGVVGALIELARGLIAGDQPQEDSGAPPVQKAEVEDLGKSEPLAKMALVHDDAASPKTVYRVQNEKGQGPHTNTNQLGLSPEQEKAWFKSPHHSMPSPSTYGTPKDNRPSPGRDFEPNEQEMISGGKNSNLLFGFESPEHAESWFGKEGLQSLGQFGFSVVPVQARKVYRSQSGKQVIFEPHEELEKAGLPMPEHHVATRQHLQLPSGTLKDGKLKVQHADGSVSWIGVRSGLVMAPSGEPTSSHRPWGTGGGK